MFGLSSSKSSSSSTTNNTTTNNVDKRLVVGEYGAGVSADNSTINMTVSSLAPEVVQSALDFAGRNDAIMGEGFGALVKSSENLFGQMADRIGSAYSLAQNDAKGGLEQKTVIMLAVIGAGVVAILFWKRG